MESERKEERAERIPGRGLYREEDRVLRVKEEKLVAATTRELSTNLPLNSQEKDSSASGDAGSDSNRSDSLSSSTNDSDISLFPCYGMREDPTTHI